MQKFIASKSLKTNPENLPEKPKDILKDLQSLTLMIIFG